MNNILQYLIVITVFWIGIDLIIRGTCGPRIHQSYRRVTSWIFRHARRQISRFAGFIWGRYRQFVLGVVCTFILLLLSGRLVV